MSSRGLNTNQIGLVSGFGNSDPKDSNHMRFQIGSVWIRMEGSFMYSEPLGLSEKILYTNRRARFGWWFGAIPSFFGFRSLEAENIFRWGWVFDEMMTRWWFQICVMFTCSWGHDPIWRPAYFSDGVFRHRGRINPNTRENEKRNERLELWERWCVIFLGFRGGEKNFTRFLLTLVVSKGSIDPLQPTRGKAPNKEVILLMVQKSQTTTWDGAETV